MRDAVQIGPTRKFQGQLAIVYPSQCRRHLEGIVEPVHQIAVDEQLLPQQRHQIGQTPAKGALQLQVLQHEHGDQRRPDLGLDGILAGPHKRLDLEGLLQRLEQLNDILPINNVQPKSPFTTTFIRCTSIACQ